MLNIFNLIPRFVYYIEHYENGTTRLYIVCSFHFFWRKIKIQELLFLVISPVLWDNTATGWHEVQAMVQSLFPWDNTAIS